MARLNAPAPHSAPESSLHAPDPVKYTLFPSPDQWQTPSVQHPGPPIPPCPAPPSPDPPATHPPLPPSRLKTTTPPASMFRVVEKVRKFIRKVFGRTSGTTDHGILGRRYVDEDDDQHSEPVPRGRTRWGMGRHHERREFALPDVVRGWGGRDQAYYVNVDSRAPEGYF